MKRALLFILLALILIAVPAGTALAAPAGSAWEVPGDFDTIQEAIDSDEVVDGDVIRVAPGEWTGAYVDKGVTIVGLGGAEITGGPAHGSGLIMGFRLTPGSDGAAISHLSFTVDLAIMNGGAVDDVTVDHCTFLDTIQGVSNWCGSGWEITHNVFKDMRARNGGGIGVLIGDYAGTPDGVNDNVVSFNKMSGVLHLGEGESGGYNGAGVCIYADFRWGAAGAVEMTNNLVSHNRIGMVSDDPELVDFDAIELSYNTYPADPPSDEEVCAVIYGNKIVFNDLRGSANAIALNPEGLADSNVISRNISVDIPNRGHGVSPAAF